MEEIASALINVADANLGKHFIEHSERSPSFRINLADPGTINLFSIILHNVKSLI